MSNYFKRPKQFNQWMKVAELKLEGSWKMSWSHRRSSMRKDGYMTGNGHNWRFIDNNKFQMSEDLENFDRWSNSVQAEVVSDFKNEQEFITVVNDMVAGKYNIDKSY